MDYTVELPMHIEGAESPEEAVEAFIDQIVTFGQRTWTYLVTDAEGNTVQVGHTLDAGHEPLQIERDLDLPDEEESDEPQPEQPPAETE